MASIPLTEMPEKVPEWMESVWCREQNSIALPQTHCQAVAEIRLLYVSLAYKMEKYDCLKIFPFPMDNWVFATVFFFVLLFFKDYPVFSSIQLWPGYFVPNIVLTLLQATVGKVFSEWCAEFFCSTFCILHVLPNGLVLVLFEQNTFFHTLGLSPARLVERFWMGRPMAFFELWLSLHCSC